MAHMRFSWFALLLIVCMVGCGGSEYRFGNTPHTLLSVGITPITQTLTSSGQTVQFIATGNYSKSPLSEDVTSQSQWTSSAPSVATVTSNGVATAVSNGTTTITATYGGMAASATITVSIASPPSRTLQSITITPNQQTLAFPGQQAQFIATGTYSADPVTQDVTNMVRWNSSAPGVAAISSGGLATAVAAGSTTITASLNGVVGNATLTVSENARELLSITVTPSNQTLALPGQQAQFIATGNYSAEPKTQDLTTQAHWSSSALNVAVVNVFGVSTALQAGTSTITASYGGMVGTATLVVTGDAPPPRTLLSITITPATQTVSVPGQQAQFIATGNYSAAPLTQDITTAVKWSSSTTNVAVITPAGGLATATGAGTTTITAASKDGPIGTATLTVSGNAPPPRKLLSIAVIPANQTIDLVGDQAQFIAIGTYDADPVNEDLTTKVVWSSSASNVATISSGGLSTATGAGSSTITANLNGVVGTGTLIVTSSNHRGDLTAITVVPNTQTVMSVGEPAQFIALGDYAGDSVPREITNQVAWSSSDSNVATISSSGLAIAVNTGAATISAKSGGVVGTATLTATATVQPRQLLSITVLPASQTTIKIGETGQFIAVGNYNGNPATEILDKVSWSSSDISVATIDPTGLATTKGPGTTTISAASGGIVGTANLTATQDAVPNQLTAINLIPSAQTAMTIGDLGQFIAIGSYTGSPGTADITKVTTWGSSAPNVASVDATGLATAIGPGTATITAAGDGTPGTGGTVGTATLTVTATAPPGELTAITIIPGSQTAKWIPETVQFLAIGTFNSIPYTQDITNQVSWSSSDTFVATIDQTGLAAAANTGSTTIIAKLKAHSGALVTGTGTYAVEPSGGPGLPILDVYFVGAAWKNGRVFDTVEAPPIIDCPSVSCSGAFNNHTVVTLVANIKKPEGLFGGFSLNCTPAIPDQYADKCDRDPQVTSCSCKVSMENTQPVGAIFNYF